MKYTHHLLLLLLLVVGCDKKTTAIKLSDREFISSVSSTSFRKTIQKVDSLLNVNNYTPHQTGLLYYEKGRNLGQLEKDVEAIVSLENALMLFEKENNQKLIAKTNMLLSVSNGFLSKKKKALAHIKVALKIYKNIDDKKEEAAALNSLSHIEFQFNNFTNAIRYLKQAAKIQLQIKDDEALAATYNNIGYVLEQNKKDDKAIDYYQKAIQLNKKNNRLNSDPLRNLGALFYINNKPKKGEVLFKEALRIEQKANRPALQKEIYDVLLENAIKNKEFEKSLFYVNKRDAIRQLLLKQENKQKTKLIEDQYKLIVSKKELQQEKKSNTKNKIIFVVLIGLLLFLGLYLMQRNRNSKLEFKQEKLRLEQKMLRIQMNPHFIFNALTAIQNSLLDDDLLKSSTYLSRFAKLIRQNYEFINKKLITLEEELDALKNYIETQQLRFEDKFEYEIRVTDALDISFVKIPPMILQPFVENAIEHGLKPKKEKGLLQILISEKGEFVQFEVIDNGVGFDNQKLLNDREHAIDVFLKRLEMRGFGEEKLFSIEALKQQSGTKVTLLLKRV